MIQISPKEILRILKDFRNIRWANGFLIGIWMFSLLMLTSSYISFEPKLRIPIGDALYQEKQPFEFLSDEISNGKYLINVGNSSYISDCLTDFKVVKPNGQSSISTYCINDEVFIENLVFKVIDIKSGAPYPIRIKKYRLYSIRWFLWLLAFILPIILWIMVYFKISKEKEVNRKLEIGQKFEDFFKKHKIKKEDFDEYIRELYR